MSYNFEANYNMLGQASDSVPGPPYVRWKLGSTYEDMSVNPAGDAPESEVVSRNLKDGNATAEELKKVNKTEEAVRTDNSDLKHDMEKRSLLNKVLLTRKGVYRVLESRISA